jgi:hypothetical protein
MTARPVASLVLMRKRRVAGSADDQYGYVVDAD